MTQYINKETGEVYNDRHIKVGEDFIINPSEETLLEHGYERVEMPENKLQQAIDAKVAEILAYNESDAVNSFLLDGVVKWVVLNKRFVIQHDIRLDIEEGKENSEIWLDGHKLVLNSKVALQLINAIERYAYEAHNVTQAHIFTVKQLASVEEVEKYDHTKNYPPKLNLKTT